MTTKTKTTKKAKPVLTTAAFIKQKIAEKKLDDDQILAAARKRAPKQKIGDHYVSWYRWQAKTTRKVAPSSKRIAYVA